MILNYGEENMIERHACAMMENKLSVAIFSPIRHCIEQAVMNFRGGRRVREHFILYVSKQPAHGTFSLDGELFLRIYLL